jgi:hypothetical protein
MCCFTGFIGMICVIGFATLAHGLWNARQSMRAAKWPTVPATITQLEVEEKSSNDDPTYYVVKLQYQYVVGDVGYTSSRIAFGYAEDSNQAAHAEIYRRLKDAKTVAARYNPSAPSQSCLSYGLHRSVVYTLASGVAVLLFVVGFTLLVWLINSSDRELLNNLVVE